MGDLRVGCGLISNFGVKYYTNTLPSSSHGCGLISNFGVKYLRLPNTDFRRVVV